MDPTFSQEDLHRFHEACDQGNLEKIIMYVEDGYPVNSHADSSFAGPLSGYTPLHFVVRYNHRQALIYLLQNGADITEKSADSWTPVHLAYYKSDNDALFTIFQHSKVNTYENAVDKMGLTHFHICCAVNLPVLGKFIENGANVNCSISLLADKNSGYTPLHFAIERGHSSIIELLFENQVDINVKGERGHIPLHMALERSDVPTIKLLLAHAADVNTKDNRGRNALHLAVEYQLSLDVVRRIIVEGASMHEPNNENETPFNMAVNKRQYDVVDEMLSHCYNDALVPFSCIFDLEDFFHACNTGPLNYVKTFLKHGFSVNSQCSDPGLKDQPMIFGATPLHFAVRNANNNIITHLLENGADITMKNSIGWTPVHLAYYVSTPHLIPLIFEHSKINTFIDVADDRGLTHFHICCALNIPQIVDNFIKIGADTNHSTSLLNNDTDPGFTPLHFAVKGGSLPTLQLLLENGADPSLICGSGSTPLHLACDVCDFNTIPAAELLLTFGANILCKDSEKRLPLHRVFYRDPNCPLADFLLDKTPTDSNHTDSQRLSLLHMACFCHRADIVKQLLDGNCCPNVRIKEIGNPIFLSGRLSLAGLTPLHVAVYTIDKATTQQLLSAGADINAEDAQGRSPLSYIYDRLCRMNTFYSCLSLDVLIGNHVKKLEAAGRHVSDKVKQMVLDNVRDTFLVDSRACIAELERLERIEIKECDDGILRKILGMSDMEMSAIVENETTMNHLNPEFLDNLAKEFRLYGLMIKAQLNSGLRKVATLRRAKLAFKYFAKLSIPDRCYKLIFQRLSKEDLENLIRARRKDERKRRRKQ